MTKGLAKFSSDQILNILSLYKNAIAVYSAENMIIELANDAMIFLWGRDKSIIGKPLQAILPDAQLKDLLPILTRVFKDGVDEKGEAIKHEFYEGTALRTHYFDYELKALKNEDGQIYAVIHSVENVTEQIVNRQILQESENRFRAMVEHAPVAMMVNKGENLVFETLNQPMIDLIGKGDNIKGKPVLEAIPELYGQPVLAQLYHTYQTGEEWTGIEVPVVLIKEGIPQQRYYNLNYRPLKDKGRIIGLLQSAIEVTEQVKARQNIQQSLDEQKKLNEKLIINNDKLAELQKNIQESESKLDQIITLLPTPIVVLKGPHQIIITTNEALLRFWDKTKEQVLGKSMLEVFPELKDQPFPAQWKQVLDTGEIIAYREEPVIFNRHGKDRLFYVDYYYQPLITIDGKREAILATIIDVTDKVQVRKRVEQAEAKLRLAIDSTELGTWFIDVKTREFIPSQRLKELFGFYDEDTMPYEAAINQIQENYRDKVIHEVEGAIKNGQSYEIEYPVIGYRDQQVRWVRATGKLYESTDDNPANFSGTMQDITQRKLKEQQKDDFISIASHELKTPITSLKASLQLLDLIKDKPNSELLPKLIEQANRSMRKLTSLIDDLLNSARTAEGQLHITSTEFLIDALLLESSAHVRLAGRHELILQGKENLLTYADIHRVDQVIVNLLNNAVKYAPDSKQIFMIVEQLENFAKVSIKDFGPGITPDKILHLFDRYFRVDHNGSHYSGLGLGLYISSEIIKRHGGQIGVDSTLGKGSTFWFTIPLSTATAHA